jgi:hypothetical protein
MCRVTEEERREQKREYARQYRVANREKVHAAAARYREANREVINERMRLGYRANPEPRKQRTLAAYWADPEKAREEHRQSRQKHGAKWSANRHQRRLNGQLNAAEMRRRAIIGRLLEDQDGLCYLCDEPLAVEDAHLEHDHRCCPRQKTFCDRCIRGAACGPCNTGIAMLRDDPDLIERVARNLRARLAEMTHLNSRTQ